MRKKEPYTVLILPGRGGRFRRVRLSRPVLRCLAGVAALLAAAIVATPHLALTVYLQSREIGRLEADNQLLRAAAERFEATLEGIAARLDRYEHDVSQIAEALGLQDVAILEAASGGGVDGAPSAQARLMGEELDALDRRARRLAGAVERLQETWEERERLLASTPRGAPVRGWFSDGFGWRVDPLTGRREFHQGLDIVASPGAVVRAPADGVVTRAGRVVGYGNAVDLFHGYGYATRYGHLSEILVQPGQRVRRGDPLGRVGSTGRSTGPHLHYEVFRHGRPVNPWLYLQGRES